MGIASFFYRLTYRAGTPRWDSSEPRPELLTLAQGRPPGRALDLGCGTGTDARYLASQGWEVVGVDFAPEAIAAATARAAASANPATFITGDVTRLAEVGVAGSFDLVIDIGCFHSLPTSRRDSYAAGVAAVTRPGSDLYIAGISRPPAAWRLVGARGVTEDDLTRHFGHDFELVGQEAGGHVGRAGTFAYFHLVRR